MSNVSGQCLCGKVAYRMASEPTRTTVCYCRFCQRATGAAQAILPVFPLADLSLRQGQPDVYTHVSEGSGKEIYLHFCADCGTRLYMTFERWPGFVGLYSGTLDDPSVVRLDGDTAKQIFVSSARPGTVLLAGVPAYWNHATTPAGAPEQAFVLDAPLAVEDLPSHRDRQ
ncbi:MAG: GFA family protein [Paracoccaceae bacterium]